MGPNSPSSTSRPLAGLSRFLQEQFDQWAKDRDPLEQKLLRNYQDAMRINRDDEGKESGISKAQKARVFIGSTRGKIRSARAKIKDVLFATGRFPFDTEPINEEMKQFADTVETILEYQLDEGGAKVALKQGVGTITTYGTGYIFGPFVEEKEHRSVQKVQQPHPYMPGQMSMGLQETVHPYPCPTWESARTLDVYPDPEAETEQDGRGIYWATRKSPQYLRNLLLTEGYSKPAIVAALNGGDETRPQGSEKAEDLRALRKFRYEDGGRIWINRYFGLVRKTELDAWLEANMTASQDPNADPHAIDDVEQAAGAIAADTPAVGPGTSPTTAPSADPVDIAYEEWVEAIVIMAGGHVIKAAENAYKKQVRPSRRCVYEEEDHEIAGVGIADNNEPHQKVTNAAFRLFIEGKSFALLPMMSIDASMFLPTEDFKLFPGKIFKFRPGLTAEQKKDAIIPIILRDITEGWQSLIEMSKEFSDEDTGITRYSQGADASSLNKTAHGISMIMNASSLPIKEVIGNIDEMWIERIVEDLLAWDLEHLEPETVNAIFGKQHAANWYAIKQFGKLDGVMDWKACGSQTFMLKEVLMNKLQGFLAIVSANPILANLVDMRELLEQVWNAGEIGKEGVVYDDDTLKKNQANSVEQQAQKMVEQVKAEAQKVIDGLAKELAAAKAQEQFKRDELASKRDIGMFEAFAKMQAGAANVEKVQAETDLAQAKTVETLIGAGVIPGAELMADAISAEDDDGNTGAREGADNGAVSMPASSGAGAEPVSAGAA